MRDTPRTDDFHDLWDSYNFPMDAIIFARKLERELNEVKADAKAVYERAAMLERQMAEMRSD